MCAHNPREPLKDNEKEIICRNAGRGAMYYLWKGKPDTREITLPGMYGAVQTKP